ncbi:MAG: NAD(P)H-dependent oxidoreductase [Granulosicoccaceae bacterium]
MKSHIVLAHPEKQSFNAHLSSISQQVLSAAGSQTTLSDLYAMGFDPREGQQHYSSRKDAEVFHAQTEQRFNADNGTVPPEIDSEIQRLLECDLLIVHFPLWWFGMPAILKGWMDRVFVYGRMYRSIMRYDKGICSWKKMIACVTTGASEESCSHNGREGDTQLHLWPLLFPFRYLGFDVLEPQVFHGVGGVAFIENHEGGLNTLEAYSNRWTETLEAVSSRPRVKYNRDEDFDETKRLVSGASVYSPFVRHSKNSLPK